MASIKRSGINRYPTDVQNKISVESENITVYYFNYI